MFSVEHLVIHFVFSQIILMVADDMACNPRNPRPGNIGFHIIKWKNNSMRFDKGMQYH